MAPGILLKDDSPLAVRNDHGAIQMASVLGARWKLLEDNYPWVEPLASRERLEEVANATDAASAEAGALPNGPYFVVFKADSDDAFAEVDEWNNSFERIQKSIYSSNKNL